MVVTAEELVKQNNEKRKQLSKDNLKYYEDMLVYIRLSYDKSEQETEEVLTELLDHLLEAQEKGKSAKDVFGEHPNEFLNDLIGELPKMVTKKRVMLVVSSIFYFLGTYLTISIINLVLFYGFGRGNSVKEIAVGSTIVQTIISILIAFLLLYTAIQILRWMCFKNFSNIKEFLLLWVYTMISIGIFLLLIFLVPDFGATITIPTYLQTITGILLLIAGYIVGNKMK